MRLNTQRSNKIRFASIVASGLGAAALTYLFMNLTGFSFVLDSRTGVVGAVILGLSTLAAAGSTHAYFMGVDESTRSLVEASKIDQRTGLLSRQGLSEDLAGIIRKAKMINPDGRNFLISFEIDALRELNECFGMETGDRVIRVLAQRLTQMMGQAGSVAHTSGPEFVVVLRTLGTDAELHAAVRALVDGLSMPVRMDNNMFSMYCNAGVYEIAEASIPLEDAMRYANLARTSARDAGRGTWSLFHEEMGHAASYRKWIEAELASAIARSELFLVYQPQVSLPGAGAFGYEALLRWNHHEVGAVPPNEFVPVAERCGMIGQLGYWVLQQACSDQVMHFPDQSVSVNVAASQLESATFVSEVRDIIFDSGIDPQKLELEVTETMLIKDIQTVIERFAELQRLGISIAIDDFGTGYSNLSTLSQISFDKVKIDKSFIDRMINGEKDCALVAAIVNLAHSINVSVIAEGVETDRQAALVQAAGCHMIQGYLYGKPKPIAEIAGTTPIRQEQDAMHQMPAQPPTAAAVEMVA